MCINPHPKKKFLTFVCFTCILFDCHSSSSFDAVRAEFIIYILEMRKLEIRDGKSLFQGYAAREKSQPRTWVCQLVCCKIALLDSYLNEISPDCSTALQFGFHSFVIILYQEKRAFWRLRCTQKILLCRKISFHQNWVQNEVSK